MATKSGSKLKKVFYVFLSFVVSLLLLVLTFSILLEATVFNKDFFIKEMNETDYFSAKKTEITRELMDLGYASGLDETFFDNLIDSANIRDDTYEYLGVFFSGDGSVVNTEGFKENFNKALDSYIEENQINPETVNQSSRDSLVDKAATIYKNNLSLPLFQTIAGYFVGIKNVMPIIIAIMSILLFFILIILFFSTKWKHRPIRYFCYSTTTTFLATIVPALWLLITGKAKQLNVTSKSFYDFFVNFVGDFTMILLYTSVGFAIFSMLLFLLFTKLYPKHKNSSENGGSTLISERLSKEETVESDDNKPSTETARVKFEN